MLVYRKGFTQPPLVNLIFDVGVFPQLPPNVFVIFFKQVTAKLLVHSVYKIYRYISYIFTTFPP